MNGVLINEVPKFLTPIPNKTTHDIKVENPFYDTHLIILPLKMKRVTSYFKVRTPTLEDYEA